MFHSLINNIFGIRRVSFRKIIHFTVLKATVWSWAAPQHRIVDNFHQTAHSQVFYYLHSKFNFVDVNVALNKNRLRSTVNSVSLKSKLHFYLFVCHAQWLKGRAEMFKVKDLAQIQKNHCSSQALIGATSALNIIERSWI